MAKIFELSPTPLSVLNGTYCDTSQRMPTNSLDSTKKKQTNRHLSDQFCGINLHFSKATVLKN